MPKLAVDMYSAAFKGKKREVNEDAAFCFRCAELLSSPLEVTAVLGAAGGMGGLGSGDAASRAAREFVESIFVTGSAVQFGDQHAVASNDAQRLLAEVFHECNRTIVRAATESRKRGVMGTTLALGMIAYHREDGKTYLHVGNVGNNRGYILRGDQIFHATEEDSVAWRMYKKGEITYSELLTHPERSVITVLGIDESIAPEIHSIELCAGDLVLFCTDGVHEALDDDEIIRIIGKHSGIAKACAKLIDAAAGVSKKTDNAAASLAGLSWADEAGPVLPPSAAGPAHESSRMPLRRKVTIGIWSLAGVLALAAVGIYFYRPHTPAPVVDGPSATADTVQAVAQAAHPARRTAASAESARQRTLALQERISDARAADVKPAPAVKTAEDRAAGVLSVEWNEETERFRIRTSDASVVPVRLQFDTMTFDLVPVKSVPNLYRSTRSLPFSSITGRRRVLIMLARSNRPVSAVFTQTK